MANRPNDMLHTYALIGAQARIETLQAEVAGILRAFPELNGGRRTTNTSNTSNTSVPASSNDRPTTRTRRKMTAAERKAVGVRMEKYWAKRRKEKAGKKATTSAPKVAKSAKVAKATKATKATKGAKGVEATKTAPASSTAQLSS